MRINTAIVGRILAAILLLISCSNFTAAVASQPHCMGYGPENGPSYERGQTLDKCPLLLSADACLQRYGSGFSLDGPEASRASCVWHEYQRGGRGNATPQLVQQVRIYSWGSNFYQPKIMRGPGKINFRDNLCEVTVTATVPPESRGKYGVYAAINGGPTSQDYTFMKDLRDPRRLAVMSGCSVSSQAASRSCSMKFAAPTGYAADERFMNNSLSVNFFVSDPARVALLTSTGQLTPNTRVYVDIVYQWHSCSVAGSSIGTGTGGNTTSSSPSKVPDRSSAHKPITHHQRGLLAKKKSSSLSSHSNKNSNNKNNKNKKPTSSSHHHHNNNKKHTNHTSTPLTPASTTPRLIDDAVIFGATPFSLQRFSSFTHSARQYTAITYRLYILQSITGAQWEVSVAGHPGATKQGKGGKGPTTPITVFLASTSGNFSFDSGCIPNAADKSNATCLPPASIKVPTSSKLCASASVCRGLASALDPTSSYYLVVSYPAYLNPGKDGVNFKAGPIKLPYATQEVRVKVWAKNWVLGRVHPASNGTA